MSSNNLVGMNSKWHSDHPQDPDHVVVVDDIKCVEFRGKPMFYMDGAPLDPEHQHQCTAISRNTKFRCRRFATLDYPVCQMHGAGSPLQGRPGGNRPTKNFHKSKMFPNDLQDRLETALNDPDLLSMEHEIAAIDTRLGQLYERLPTEAASSFNFKEIVEGLSMLRQAQKDNDEELFASGLDVIMASSADMTSEYSIWEEILKLQSKRARLVNQEISRRKALKGYLRAEEAWALIQFLIGTINELVPDIQTRTAIAVRVEHYISSNERASIKAFTR